MRHLLASNNALGAFLGDRPISLHVKTISFGAIANLLRSDAREGNDHGPASSSFVDVYRGLPRFLGDMGEVEAKNSWLRCSA